MSVGIESWYLRDYCALIRVLCLCDLYTTRVQKLASSREMSRVFTSFGEKNCT